VVILLSSGLTNRRIAATLVVSGRTVEWHVSKVLSKLGLESRAQLALWARDNGITAAE
jgi:DNA-binding NarL/FixJ family response regulator